MCKLFRHIKKNSINYNNLYKKLEKLDKILKILKKGRL
jgi:hypothetical protein